MTEALEPPETLLTGRLLLRRPAPEDAPAMFRNYASDPDVTRFLTWHAHADLDETRRVIDMFRRQWDEGGERIYAIALRDRPDDPFGTIGFGLGDHGARFGYALGNGFRGRGYTPEALAGLADRLLSGGTVWRAWTYCDVENTPSARVMEKAGIAFEGRVRRFDRAPKLSPDPRGCLLYAKTRDDLQQAVRAQATGA